jgi:glycosyltransferase involved in cell wall biosynthesis
MPTLVHIFDYVPRLPRAMDHFAREYAHQATLRGWTVTLGFTADPPAEWAAELKAAGASLLTFPAPLTLATAADIAARLGPIDILQTSFYSPFDPAVQHFKLSGACRRLVMIDHASGVGPTSRGPLRWLRRWRGRRVGRIIDGLACVSQYNATRAIERVFLPAAKIAVIPNGIDLARFPLAPLIERSPIRIAYAGQLSTAKGVHTLLRAAEILNNQSKLAAFELTLAGAGPLAATHAADSPPNVRWLGHVGNMAEYFGNADIAVVPSEWAEAFGLVVVEAMACGAAVIASDAGALPEVANDAGLITPAGDASRLAETIARLMTDKPLRADLRIRGRARVEKHYQLADCVRAHLDFAIGSQS